MLETEITPTNKSTARKVPTLSLAQFTDGTAAQSIQFIEELYRGLKEYGFVILRDHNVSTHLLDEAYEISRRFFALPEGLKKQYVSFGGQRGYTPFGKEHAKNALVMDLKEFWHVGRELAPGHPLREVSPPNVWPSEIPRFQPLFLQLYNELDKAGRAMLQALTVPLELDPLFFENMVEDGNSILRLLHYPPIPAGTDPRCLRAAPHEDINLITILPSATCSGLQLLDRNGQWLDVVSEKNDLIVDAGDMLARITNDIIPATTHQVINTPEAGSTSRYSMPFFMHPHPNAVLSCLPSCVGAGAKYADISAHDFLMQRLREIGLAD